MKNSPITNLLGTFFLLFGIGLLILPMIIEVKKDYTDALWLPIGFIGGGIAFIFIPDKVIAGLAYLIERKGKEL